MKIILTGAILRFVCCHVGEKDMRGVEAEGVKGVDGDTINVIVANTNEKLKLGLYGIVASARSEVWKESKKHSQLPCR